MRGLSAAMAVVAASVVGLWGSVAAAGGLASDTKTEVKVVQEEDRTVYRKKTVIDFTDVAVEGELTRPEGSYVLHRKRADFESLIRVRDDFDPELQKSVDNL